MGRLLKIVFLFILLCAGTLRCPAEIDTPVLPDFNAIFEKLRLNIIDYNRYNDSIFLIHDHNDWIQFFLHRAERHHEIYDENKRMLGEIMTYFDTGTHEVPDTAYPALFAAYYEFTQKDDMGTGDPFFSADICNILEQHYKDNPCNDANNPILRIKVWQGMAYWNMFNLTKDINFARKSKECMMAAYESKNTNLALYHVCNFMGTFNLLQSTWVANKLITLPEHMTIRKHMKELLQDSLTQRLIRPKNIADARYYVKTADDQLARNIGIVDTVTIPKHFTDSILHHIEARNDTLRSMQAMAYYNNLLFKTYLKHISYEEALERSMKRYNWERKKLATVHFDDRELQRFVDQYYTLAYFNDTADISEYQKRKNVLRFCHDIVKVYQQRKSQQNSTSYISNLGRLVTYHRLLKHLTSKERIQFLNDMYVATQVTTYAHCVHVAELAAVVMDGILEYQPELLAGTLGCKSAKAVTRHKKKYRKFIHDAAMYHDLGKNSIISIITNEYRPTTDQEYAIIKTHPRQGLKYLAIAPTLARYTDTTLGHHKWYNGKGGYPPDFDNTASDKRILIDIVTLCDCMQAATEKVGRNYKSNKTFDKVMGELTRDAGVRYNPDLVNLIRQHADIAAKLDNLVQDGWLEIYYNIYSKFFKD